MVAFDEFLSLRSDKSQQALDCVVAAIPHPEDTAEKFLKELRANRRAFGVAKRRGTAYRDAATAINVYRSLITTLAQSGDHFASDPKKIRFYSPIDALELVVDTGAVSPITVGRYTGAPTHMIGHQGSVILLPPSIFNTRDLPHIIVHELSHSEGLSTMTNYRAFLKTAKLPGDQFSIKHLGEGANIAQTLTHLTNVRNSYELAYDGALEHVDAAVSAFLGDTPQLHQSSRGKQHPYYHADIGAATLLAATQGISAFDAAMISITPK